MLNSRMKPIALAVALASTSLLPACAGTGGQMGSTGTGAAAGSVVGGLLGYAAGGDAESAIAGAVVGALIGGFVAHQQVRNSQQVYERHGKSEQVVLNDLQLSKQSLQPGQEGEAMVNYDVVAPDPNAEQSITHTMEYYYGNSKLASNTQTVNVTPGGYQTVFPVAVPEGADEGEYTLVAQVQSPNAADRKEASFTVNYARNEHGVLEVASITPR